MPNLTFALPHWLYWSGLIVFPLVAMFLLHRQREDALVSEASLPLGYALLLTGGFVGLHRFYLRSALGWIFIPLFVGVLLVNVEIRDSRDAISRESNEVTSAQFLIERAQERVEEGREGAGQELEEARAALARAEAALASVKQRAEDLDLYVKLVAGLILLLLVVDALLLPKLHRRCRELDEKDPRHTSTYTCPPVSTRGTQEDPTSGVHTRITDAVDRLNFFAGSFVAYWSPIAVIVYYYEVVARYVFNSPTNWAHESMFLMFGMQYLIAGGFCLREDAHVRVDVIYMHLSQRAKALVDVLTSVFFFIFVTALVWTGWIFFMDSWRVKEVSFTEWAVQYYPVKLAIAVGAALLLLQGLARLSKDIVVLTRGDGNGS